tara:strand:- start:2300 stop:2518 length:219 start_codon:yes stop_codon:yes gene_type:complete
MALLKKRVLKAKKAPAKQKAAVKKAHASDGKFVADDPSTPENEHLGEVPSPRAAQLSTPGGGGRRLGGKLIG